MLVVRCKSCGVLSYGYALRYTLELKCSRCGAPLIAPGSQNEISSREIGEKPKIFAGPAFDSPTNQP
jgi:DNA-directed RNA polymerase subunit RPC12/RpoP